MKRIHLPLLIFLVAWLQMPRASGTPSEAPKSERCPRCGWIAPTTTRTTIVKNLGQLEQAVADAKPDTTILIEDGVYWLDRMLDIATPHVVLRGRSGNRSAVVLRGADMTEGRVGVAISISAPDVTIADLTVGQVASHGIQIRGERGASRAFIHNVNVVDTGQHLVKGSVGHGAPYADDGTIACSHIGYTDHAPSDYTAGIDLLATRGWTIRDNRFDRVRGPGQGAAGPAILVWANSQDTIVERNLVVDSFRGIALGLGPGVTTFSRDDEHVIDHRGGVIRNNVVVNLNPWADEGIEANSAPGVRIEHNTVVTMSRSLDWAISLRFPATHAIVRNNLTNHQIVFRTGGHGELDGNVPTAGLDWFVNPREPNLHLTSLASMARGTGVQVPEVADDFDRRVRMPHARPDVGAFAFEGGRAR